MSLSDLGPVGVGEDVGDVGGQAGAGHRVPVVGGELDQGGRHLVQLDQTFLVKQLHGLLLGGLLEGGNVSRNLRELSEREVLEN